jgi:hypothetical protein
MRRWLSSVHDAVRRSQQVDCHEVDSGKIFKTFVIGRIPADSVVRHEHSVLWLSAISHNFLSLGRIEQTSNWGRTHLPLPLGKKVQTAIVIVCQGLLIADRR